jgi:hypothetical protein
MNHIEKEKLIKADIASIENRVRHAFNQGYDLGYKEGKANRSEIPTGSTTKNCRTCRNFGSHHGICEICKDNKCWTEKEPTTKNNLGVDCISRAQTQIEIEMNASRYTIARERGGMGQVEWSDQLIKVSDAVGIIRKLPYVTPQEPTDKNFTKADIDAITKAINKGWELRVNEILSKIRAEIEGCEDRVRSNEDYDKAEYVAYTDAITDALVILDKYKADTENT